MSNDDFGMESMLEIFIHETEEMLEDLDNILLESERAKSITEDNINTIFRITHTIKGSAAMMNFNNISSLAHSVEDVFYILREDPTKLSLVFDSIFDLVFQASDYFKKELEALQSDNYQEGDPSDIITHLEEQAAIIKGELPAAEVQQAAAPDSENVENAEPEVGGMPSGEGTLRIHIMFEPECGMENIRAYMVISQVQPYCAEIASIPPSPENDQSLAPEIAKGGFTIICKPKGSPEEVVKVVESAMNVKSYEILADVEPAADAAQEVSAEASNAKTAASTSAAPDPTNSSKPSVDTNALTKGVKQSLISVNQGKLDHLMDLVGEIVTAESMVARNPDLKGLRLDNFTKSIRELRKLTDELQDIVMSIRMVPLQGTFYKMDRIVRDMSKKLGKKAELVTEGGDTEVDKTINDAIVDPFMHMVRNSMDHAIEMPEERIAAGKPEVGKITLAAKNTGGEIFITISDDGAGLDTEKILNKARENGILTKPESAYSDREIFNLIMLPGFSTNEQVTAFSGRGVGMDVVRKNIEQVGGTINISSERGKGTTFTIKIPLTLAIVDGMNIAVGKTIFTLPITAIRQSFKITDENQIIHNTDGSEMIILRGECYPVVRLRDLYDIEEGTDNLLEGILIQVDSGESGYCIFADELLGEYQVVVKPFPIFLNKYDLKSKGLSGCSVLGDGSISLILDVNTLKND
ncbi:MAG: ATP-binding protein [Oscillospiraceae bacterium]